MNYAMITNHAHACMHKRPSAPLPLGEPEPKKIDLVTPKMVKQMS